MKKFLENHFEQICSLGWRLRQLLLYGGCVIVFIALYLASFPLLLLSAAMTGAVGGFNLFLELSWKNSWGIKSAQ